MPITMGIYKKGPLRRFLDMFRRYFRIRNSA